jgi:hypothetical protein
MAAADATKQTGNPDAGRVIVCKAASAPEYMPGWQYVGGLTEDIENDVTRLFIGEKTSDKTIDAWADRFSLARGEMIAIRDEVRHG